MTADDTPRPALTVRRAAPFDSAAIAALQVESWRAAYQELMPQPFLDALSAETRADQWHTILRDAGSDERTWTGVHDATLSGFVSAGPTRDGRLNLRTGELYALYLLPGAWGSGLGAMLLDAAMAWFEERGYGDATLWVLADNARARRFFEREGWSPDGAETSVSFGGDRLTELRYRREMLAG